MTQIYQYGVAALFIEVIVIFFYFQKRSLALFQNIIFPEQAELMSYLAPSYTGHGPGTPLVSAGSL